MYLWGRLAQCLAFTENNGGHFKNAIPKRTTDEIARLFFPSGVPFSKSRLNRLIPQMIDTREQWLDPSGSFIATNTELLPKGGQKEMRTSPLSQLSAYFIADMGFNSEQRKCLLEKLQSHLCEQPDDFNTLVIGGGDWAYPHGPENNSIQELDRINETVLGDTAQLAQIAPFIASLGNHEYGDDSGPSDPNVMIKSFQEKNFLMPGRYFSISHEHTNWGVDFLILDSTNLACDTDQQKWFHKAVEQSVKKESTEGVNRWRIMVSHHPTLSYGYHHGRTEYIQSLLHEGIKDIHLLLSGHEHDVQFIINPKDNLPILICGTSSESREMTKGGPGTKFHSNAPCFSRLMMNEKQLKAQIFSLNITNGEKNTPHLSQSFEYQINRKA